MASQEIEALANALARLPGLGPRSARRAVLHLMKRREGALQPLLSALQTVSERLSTCSICGRLRRGIARRCWSPFGEHRDA